MAAHRSGPTTLRRVQATSPHAEFSAHAPVQVGRCNGVHVHKGHVRDAHACQSHSDAGPDASRANDEAALLAHQLLRNKATVLRSKRCSGRPEVRLRGLRRGTCLATISSVNSLTSSKSTRCCCRENAAVERSAGTAPSGLAAAAAAIARPAGDLAMCLEFASGKNQWPAVGQHFWPLGLID